MIEAITLKRLVIVIIVVVVVAVIIKWIISGETPQSTKLKFH